MRTVIASHVSFLTVSRLREVHVSISKGAPGDHVSAYPNGEHRSGWAEFLIQHSLRDIGVQVANVEGSHRITPRRCVHISGLHKSKCKASFKNVRERKRNAGRLRTVSWVQTALQFWPYKDTDSWVSGRA